MRVPLAAGRDFTDADRDGAPEVVIVSQHLADTHFPGEGAIGKRIRVWSSGDWRTIVGVTRHVVRSDWQDRPDDEVYLPLRQVPSYRDNMRPSTGYLSFVVRAAGDPATIIPSLRATVRSLSPSAPVSDVIVMSHAVRDATLGAEFVLVLITDLRGHRLAACGRRHLRRDEPQRRHAPARDRHPHGAWRLAVAHRRWRGRRRHGGDGRSA